MEAIAYRDIKKGEELSIACKSRNKHPSPDMKKKKKKPSAF